MLRHMVAATQPIRTTAYMKFFEVFRTTVRNRLVHPVVSTAAATSVSPLHANGENGMLPWQVDVTIIG